MHRADGQDWSGVGVPGAARAWPWIAEDWDGNPSRVPHWWLLAAGRGVRAHREIVTALAAAQAQIARSRVPRCESADAKAFTRACVRDALPAAPQPVTREWVAYSTSTVGHLVAACERSRVPLDRRRVFGPRQVDRLLHVDLASLSTGTKASYRSRLIVIADALLGDLQSVGPRPRLGRFDTQAPYTEREIARLSAWAAHLRPESRRRRLRAALALSLGGGLTRGDALAVTGDHVRRTRRGVQVIAGTGARLRTITILTTWESDVAEAAELAGPNLLLGPERPTLGDDALDQSLHRTNRTAPVPFVIGKARNTWLVHHLTAGTPLRVLMQAAGLATLEHLEDLLRFIPPPGGDEAARWLRGSA